MSCGTPVSIIGCLPADEQNAWIVPVRDAAAIERAVEAFTSLPEGKLQAKIDCAALGRVLQLGCSIKGIHKPTGSRYEPMIYLLVLLTCALVVHATQREHVLAILVVACGLATFVALQAPETSNDFLGYQEWYGIGTEGVLERPPILESLFFAGMAIGNEAGLPFRLFLWLVAAGAITLKLYSIRRVAVSGAALWTGVSCYLFSDFLLHEFTQLRAGLAIAFFMLSMVFLGDGRMRAYLVATCAGALIHSAALLGLLAWPLSRFRLGRLDLMLLGALAAAVAARVSGIPTLDRFAEDLSALDLRLALYVQLATSGVDEPLNPVSIRSVLVLLLILTSYVALVRRERRRASRRGANQTIPAQPAFLTLLRLIVLGQIALFAFAEVREMGLRVMEFWMACLPLYGARLAQTRGMRVPLAIVWVWLAATFVNYVFREPALVNPYSIGL